MAGRNLSLSGLVGPGMFLGGAGRSLAPSLRNLHVVTEGHLSSQL